MSAGQGLPRPIECALCLGALVAAAPVLAAVAVAVRVTTPGPVLFRHRRMGRHGRPFEMLKFRTMHHGTAGPAVTAGNDRRITAIGRMLRKTKLDELPELWNVVRGDMSLVGPRPEAVEYATPVEAAWKEVLEVRPGITDPMTLQLRNEEELLAAAGPDPEAFYRSYLLPYKLNGYRAYLTDRTWKRDLSVLVATVLGIVRPTRVPAPSPDQIVSAIRIPTAAPGRQIVH